MMKPCSLAFKSPLLFLPALRCRLGNATLRALWLLTLLKRHSSSHSFSSLFSFASFKIQLSLPPPLLQASLKCFSLSGWFAPRAPLRVHLWVTVPHSQPWLWHQTLLSLGAGGCGMQTAIPSTEHREALHIYIYQELMDFFMRKQTNREMMEDTTVHHCSQSSGQSGTGTLILKIFHSS